MARGKRISDQVISQKRIESAYEKNKARIDFLKISHPFAFYQKRISECEPATYGKRVRELRTKKKISQKVFAMQIGTTTATLSKIENGQLKTINIDLMYNICGIYNTNPSYLIAETSEPTVYKSIDAVTGEETYLIESLDHYPQSAFELYQELQAATNAHLPRTNIEEIDKIAQERFELCDLMLTVLQSDDPELMEQVTNILRGLVQSAEWRLNYGVNPG